MKKKYFSFLWIFIIFFVFIFIELIGLQKITNAQITETTSEKNNLFSLIKNSSKPIKLAEHPSYGDGTYDGHGGYFSRKERLIIFLLEESPRKIKKIILKYFNLKSWFMEIKRIISK